MNIRIQNTGIGLRHPHLAQILRDKPDIAWLEVHSENFFYPSLATEQLTDIGNIYPLSLHGVGLSLGSAGALNSSHLQDLKAAVAQFQPALISEHLAWSSIDGNHSHDLLPLPYTVQALHNFADNVKRVQDELSRQILIENPSSYLQFTASTMPEWDFFAQLPALCGCGLLLDVNNIYVSCVNHQHHFSDYLGAIDGADVGEIHLAGYTEKRLKNGVILIDDHSKKVSENVWDLYQTTLQKIGKKPTLIEWDTNIPDLSVLLDEAAIAQGYLDA